MNRSPSVFLGIIALVSGEIGNVVLDALGAFSPANVRAHFGELAEALGPFLEILFYVVSS
jgi:hypothetical protein